MSFWPCRALKCTILALPTILLAAALAACGGRQAAQPELPASGSPQSVDRSIPGLGPRAVPQLAPEPPMPRAAMPGIDLMLEQFRGSSVTGPGYEVIEPQRYISAVNFASIPGGKLANNNLPPFAWAVYGLDSYPSDSFPTDLKVTVDTTDQEYWVAFADFAEQRWTFNGPFTASAQVELPFPSPARPPVCGTMSRRTAAHFS